MAEEPQAVRQQEQQQRTEGSGEAGAEAAADASSKLVLVVGGTGGVDPCRAVGGGIFTEQEHQDKVVAKRSCKGSDPIRRAR